LNLRKAKFENRDITDRDIAFQVPRVTETRRLSSAMGHNWIQLVQPPPTAAAASALKKESLSGGGVSPAAARERVTAATARRHSVAVQVACESEGLKPVYHLIGFKG
jgi:hypothetical protein